MNVALVVRCSVVGLVLAMVSALAATTRSTMWAAGPPTCELLVGFCDDDSRLTQRSHWIRELRPTERAEVDRGWWIESSERVTAAGF